MGHVLSVWKTKKYTISHEWLQITKNIKIVRWWSRVQPFLFQNLMTHVLHWKYYFTQNWFCKIFWYVYTKTLLSEKWDFTIMHIQNKYLMHSKEKNNIFPELICDRLTINLHLSEMFWELILQFLDVNILVSIVSGQKR